MQPCTHRHQAREYMCALSPRLNSMSLRLISVVVIQIPDIENHISSELHCTPSPVSRNVDVPIPTIPSPYAHPFPVAMTIPRSRAVMAGKRESTASSVSRRVQILE